MTYLTAVTPYLLFYQTIFAELYVYLLLLFYSCVCVYFQCCQQNAEGLPSDGVQHGPVYVLCILCTDAYLYEV